MKSDNYEWQNPLVRLQDAANSCLYFKIRNPPVITILLQVGDLGILDLFYKVIGGCGDVIHRIQGG